MHAVHKVGDSPMVYESLWNNAEQVDENMSRIWDDEQTSQKI